ncbi:hypothetical protein GJAV_G00234960 [Gymnothorax javanicus]|nr:hypothetical protein GJAV_G00234960 [Gymnothorax javanicus]
MGETVQYSSVKFKKNLRRETKVTQDEDVTYTEVRSSNPTSSDTVCPSAPAERECKPCPQGWDQFHSKCYFFSTESKSWTESRSDCIKRGADLVIIESQEEQDFISRSYYSNYDRWIGLSDTVTEGTWLWVDGSPLQGGFWRSGEPNDQHHYRGTDCAFTAQRQKAWIDTNCEWFRQFISSSSAAPSQVTAALGASQLMLFNLPSPSAPPPQTQVSNQDVPNATQQYRRRKQQTGSVTRKYEEKTDVILCRKCNKERTPPSHLQYFGNWYCGEPETQSYAEWRADLET